MKVKILERTPAQLRRWLDVQSALDARRTAHQLRRAGCLEPAQLAWAIVRTHLQLRRREVAAARAQPVNPVHPTDYLTGVMLQASGLGNVSGR